MLPLDRERETSSMSSIHPGIRRSISSPKQLANIKERDRLECNVCQLPLQRKMLLQNHAVSSRCHLLTPGVMRLHGVRMSV